jgi:type IV pilus assembly protein PilY1
VLFASNNGFSGLNVFDGGTDLGFTGDFTDAGPTDHGALFDFGFGDLGIGESFTFEIFYGAALTEAGAFTALNAVGAEVYSLGQSSLDQFGGTPGYSTFIFGFAGVGGIVVPPPPVPLPGSALLLLGGVGLLGGLRLRRRVA